MRLTEVTEGRLTQDLSARDCPQIFIFILLVLGNNFLKRCALNTKNPHKVDT